MKKNTLWLTLLCLSLLTAWCEKQSLRPGTYQGHPVGPVCTPSPLNRVGPGAGWGTAPMLQGAVHGFCFLFCGSTQFGLRSR